MVIEKKDYYMIEFVKGIEIAKITDFQEKNFSKALNEIFLLTYFNTKQYPGYQEWFYLKNLPRLFNETGEILFYLDGLTIAGVTILKKAVDEKKICTFYIDEEYRNRGLGFYMMEQSLIMLESDHPLITVPLSRLDEFSKILEEFDFKQTGIIDDYNSKEIIFNGLTLKK